MQDIVLIADKVLNSLIHGSPSTSSHTQVTNLRKWIVLYGLN